MACHEQPKTRHRAAFLFFGVGCVSALITHPSRMSPPAPAARKRAVVTKSSVEEAATGNGREKPRVVVVGGGWGGFGAAKALSENGCDVTLIDAASMAEMKTPTGKPFEPGMRGCVVSTLGCESSPNLASGRTTRTLMRLAMSSSWATFTLTSPRVLSSDHTVLNARCVVYS